MSNIVDKNTQSLELYIVHYNTLNNGDKCFFVSIDPRKTFKFYESLKNKEDAKLIKNTRYMKACKYGRAIPLTPEDLENYALESEYFENVINNRFKSKYVKEEVEVIDPELLKILPPKPPD